MLKSFRFTFFLAFPITLGLMAVSNEFIPIFLGDGYRDAIMIANILAPTIIGMGITNVIGVQYLLTTRKQKKYTISIVAGLIANVVLNWILINTSGAFGASIATTISQFIVVAVQIYYVKNDFNLKKIALSSKKYLIASAVMFVACFIAGIIIRDPLPSVIVKVIIGMITYGLMLIILGDKYVYEVRDIIISKIKRRKEKSVQ